MTLLQYYIYANIYLILFWIVFRLCLKDSTYFRQVRFYLNSIVLIALALPFMHAYLVDIISSFGGTQIKTSTNLPVVTLTYTNIEAATTESGSSGSKFQLVTIVTSILLAGSLFNLFTFLARHISIMKIISRSECVSTLRGAKIYESEETDIPFIYNKHIVLPVGLSDNDHKLSINHELLHQRFYHGWDLVIFSLVQTLYFMNPFFYLLKKDLVMNHEYQVDKALLKEDFDPEHYKLSLIKHSAGKRRFHMVNGLSGRRLKKRLLMMDKTFKAATWKIYLVFPVAVIILALFAFACVPKEKEQVQADSPQSNILSDSIPQMTSIDTLGNQKNITNEQVILILMNRDSKIMVSGKVITPEEIVTAIVDRCWEIFASLNIEDNFKGPISEFPDVDIIFRVQIDKQTEIIDVQDLKRGMRTATVQFGKEVSLAYFGEEYSSLDDARRKIINNIMPLTIIFTSKSFEWEE